MKSDPPSLAKQIDFKGVGTFKNIGEDSALKADAMAGATLHWFEVHIEDLGEPGKNDRQNAASPSRCPAEGSSGGVADCGCPDFYGITIHATDDPVSEVIYEVYGYITSGNLQIHHPVK